MTMFEEFAEQIEIIKAYPNYFCEIRAAFEDADIIKHARFEKDPARLAFLKAVNSIMMRAHIFVNLDHGNNLNLPEDVLEDHRAARAALKEAFPMLEKISGWIDIKV